MIDRTKQVGITYGNVKNSYLYFDYIVPILKPPELPNKVLPPKMLKEEYTHKDRIGTQIVMDEDSGREYVCPLYPPYHPAVLHRLPKSNKNWLTRRKIKNGNIDELRHLSPALDRLARDLKYLGYMPIIIIDQESVSLEHKTGFEAISLISSNVAEVEVESKEWRQLKDFKKDTDSLKALRNYRLFWIDKYTGKSKLYIEDDLEKKYERFCKSCKKHGLEITHTISNNIIRSRSLFTSSLTALTAAILNEPTTASISMLTGAAITIGHLTIEIKKTRVEQKEFVENNDLLYLYKLSSEFSEDESFRLS